MTDPALEALWKNVLNHWEQDKAHGAFLEHCQRTDQLLEAAVRYRGMAGDHQRGPVAQKRLTAITLLALAQLESGRASDRPARRHWFKWILVALFLCGTVAVLTALAGPP